MGNVYALIVSSRMEAQLSYCRFVACRVQRRRFVAVKHAGREFVKSNRDASAGSHADPSHGTQWKNRVYDRYPSYL